MRSGTVTPVPEGKDLNDTQPIRLTNPVTGANRTILPRPTEERDAQLAKGKNDPVPLKLSSGNKTALVYDRASTIEPVALHVLVPGS